jgi:hypothetical protein
MGGIVMPRAWTKGEVECNTAFVPLVCNRTFGHRGYHGYFDESTGYWVVPQESMVTKPQKEGCGE